MTDVVNAATGTKKSGKGLTMTRLYTTEGVHPYAEVIWENRDVVQTNWKGHNNHCQHYKLWTKSR